MSELVNPQHEYAQENRGGEEEEEQKKAVAITAQPKLLARFTIRLAHIQEQDTGKGEYERKVEDRTQPIIDGPFERLQRPLDSKKEEADQ